jgi:hypothetical protein
MLLEAAYRVMTYKSEHQEEKRDQESAHFY